MINQQRPMVLSALWGSCQQGQTLHQLTQLGHDFLICPNQNLPLAGSSIDLVVTNSIAIDQTVLGEPTIQSSEIQRILASPGRWVHDGLIRLQRP